MGTKHTRRDFIRSAGTIAAAAPFMTSDLLAKPSGGALRHASFGAAGMAWADIQSICSNSFVELVAVAEVDLNRIEQVKGWFPNVRVYQDWRELLDQEHRNIDSVNVSTPDHTHAQIALSSMQLGKHVYCQKPLAHDIHETRVLTHMARIQKVVTQMGIQVHSLQAYRQVPLIIQSGVIGKVREVHSWSNKKWGALGAPPDRSDPIPEGFDWDIWLSGQEHRPYVAGYYHPGEWRKRLDFGTGTFGDMGCHILDPVFAALELTSPISVRSEAPAPDTWNWAIDARVKYIFPATRYTDGETMTLHWYDGDERPPADVLKLVDGETILHGDSPYAQGSILIGSEGVLHVPHQHPLKLFPESQFDGYTLPHAEDRHHWSEWAEAIVFGGETSTPFDYSGPLTEAVLLGSVAARFPDTTLEWNARRLQFDNESTANRFVRRGYLHNWKIPGL